MVAYKDVLKRLVMYRKSMGLMQTDIAEKFGLMQEQYSYIENGGIIIKWTDTYEFFGNRI